MRLVFTLLDVIIFWMVVTVYWIPLIPVTSFNYLGRVLLTEYNDWPDVVHNLWRS